MSTVTGPISSLPGSQHAVPFGTSCDNCGKPARIRIQGETDSMGAEMNDLCWECNNIHSSVISGECDWCHLSADILKPTRDYDEGSSGPIYYVCSSCIANRNKEDREELLAMNECLEVYGDDEPWIEDDF